MIQTPDDRILACVTLVMTLSVVMAYHQLCNVPFLWKYQRVFFLGNADRHVLFGHRHGGYRHGP